jgi:hypothetical protein
MELMQPIKQPTASCLDIRHMTQASLTCLVSRITGHVVLPDFHRSGNRVYEAPLKIC